MKKINKKWYAVLILPMLLLFMGAEDNCDANQSGNTQSNSGVTQAKTTVQTGSDGLTIEQRNIKSRLEEDNKPGAIKHLYIISPYSGQVLIYSTVKGKVTSGHKRLTPSVVSAIDGQYVGAGHQGIATSIAGQTYYSPEILGDDGAYGSSGDYLYWWDVQGRYHQHYLTGGQILHISDQPLPIKSVVINMELDKQ